MTTPQTLSPEPSEVSEESKSLLIVPRAKSFIRNLSHERVWISSTFGSIYQEAKTTDLEAVNIHAEVNYSLIPAYLSI